MLVEKRVPQENVFRLPPLPSQETLKQLKILEKVLSECGLNYRTSSFCEIEQVVRIQIYSDSGDICFTSAGGGLETLEENLITALRQGIISYHVRLTGVNKTESLIGFGLGSHQEQARLFALMNLLCKEYFDLFCLGLSNFSTEVQWSSLLPLCKGYNSKIEQLKRFGVNELEAFGSSTPYQLKIAVLVPLMDNGKTKISPIAIGCGITMQTAFDNALFRLIEKVHFDTDAERLARKKRRTAFYQSFNLEPIYNITDQEFIALDADFTDLEKTGKHQEFNIKRLFSGWSGEMPDGPVGIEFTQLKTFSDGSLIVTAKKIET